MIFWDSMPAFGGVLIDSVPSLPFWEWYSMHLQRCRRQRKLEIKARKRRQQEEDGSKWWYLFCPPSKIGAPQLIRHPKCFQLLCILCWIFQGRTVKQLEAFAWEACACCESFAKFDWESVLQSLLIIGLISVNELELNHGTVEVEISWNWVGFDKEGQKFSA